MAAALVARGALVAAGARAAVVRPVLFGELGDSVVVPATTRATLRATSMPKEIRAGRSKHVPLLNISVRLDGGRAAIPLGDEITVAAEARAFLNAWHSCVDALRKISVALR